jgi:hypothetical protein
MALIMTVVTAPLLTLIGCPGVRVCNAGGAMGVSQSVR